MLAQKRRYGLAMVWALLACTGLCTASLGQEKKRDAIKLPEGVPAKVGKVLDYVDEHHKAMEGYEGGRTFGNFDACAAERREREIHQISRMGRQSSKSGVNRGVQRLITGSNNSAYYTDDHYKTFKKIR